MTYVLLLNMYLYKYLITLNLIDIILSINYVKYKIVKQLLIIRMKLAMKSFIVSLVFVVSMITSLPVYGQESITNSIKDQVKLLQKK